MAKKATTIQTPVKKPIQQGGYVYKPIKSTILECDCGNKYIKTRHAQKECVLCLNA